MLHNPDIKEIADRTRHCGDYGLFYLHRDQKIIGVVAGDSDEINVENFKMFGYKVIVEAECDRWENDPDYILFSRGTEYHEGDPEYDIEEYCEKIKLTKEQELKTTLLFTDPFEHWLNSSYGEFSTRCEHMTESEIKWARAAFEAAIQLCR